MALHAHLRTVPHVGQTLRHSSGVDGTLPSEGVAGGDTEWSSAHTAATAAGVGTRLSPRDTAGVAFAGATDRASIAEAVAWSLLAGTKSSST
jgi:hypothetical protein